MPISEIIRPIPSELDEKKVDSIADVLKVKKFASKLIHDIQTLGFEPEIFFFSISSQINFN